MSSRRANFSYKARRITDSYWDANHSDGPSYLRATPRFFKTPSPEKPHSTPAANTTVLLRVWNEYFTAGAVWRRVNGAWGCKECAPILAWMKKKTPLEVKMELIRKGCDYEWIAANSHDMEVGRRCAEPPNIGRLTCDVKSQEGGGGPTISSPPTGHDYSAMMSRESAGAGPDLPSLQTEHPNTQG